VVEHCNAWDIIVLRNSKYICYRHGGLSNFNKSIEVENTVKYINQMLMVDPNEIVIYEIGSDAIDGFLTPSSVRMNIVFKDASQQTPNSLLKIGNIIKTVSCLLFALGCVGTIYNCSKAITYKGKFSQGMKVIKKISPDIIRELHLWNGVSADYFTRSHIDFKGLIDERRQKLKLNVLRSASVNIDLNNVKVELISEDAQ
jgi:hypothetical protein